MIDMKAYGFPCGESVPSGLLPARITEVRREQYRAVCPEGEAWAILTGAFLHRAGEPGKSPAAGEYPAVGNFVFLRHNPHGPSGIVRPLPRRTKFSRANFSRHAAGYAKTIVEQVVAANFDTVLILSSLNQDFNIQRIGRYLTQANAGGGVPVVVLTKADLCADPSEAVAAVQSLAPSVATVVVSSQTGQGMEALSAFLVPGQRPCCWACRGLANRRF